MKNKLILNYSFLFFLGVISALSLPPYNFYLVNFFTLSLLFITLFKNLDVFKKKDFFFFGWFFGYGYFLASLYWISISLTFDKSFNFLIPFAIIIVPAFLALFYGVITLTFFLFKIKKVLSSFLLFSLLFGIIEFCRGNIFTGFPWNLFVYSLTDELIFISIISLIGTYSLNLILVSIFAAPAILILRKSKSEFVFCISLLVLLPILFLGYGKFYNKKFSEKILKKNEIIIRAIGSNISLDRFYFEKQPEKILNELIKISSPDQQKKILFLWPEGIVPGVSQDELYLYEDIFSQNFDEKHIIGLGINNKRLIGGNYKYYNSFSIFDNKLNLLDYYNKINLVPFGEFLPFEKVFSNLGLKSITNSYQPYSKGKKRDIIQIQIEKSILSVLPLICYEIIYTGNLSKNNNFNFILNISEDGWFGKSIGPKQHFAHSIFRAIETGKYIIRSSNNGIAAIINPIGVVEKKVSFGKDGYIDFEQSKKIEKTIFSTFGNKIFVFITLLYIFLIISFNRLENE